MIAALARSWLIGLVIATSQAFAGPTEPAPEQLPALPLRAEAGGPAVLSELPRRPTVLNVWATWCGPCRKEMPALQALAGRLKEYGIDVVALSVDDDLKLMEEFLLKYAITLPTPVAVSASETFRQLEAIALPVTYYVAANGRIVGKYLGAREWDQDDALQDILDALGSATAAR
ncbi:MAG: TlpA family protein disulfide reductase [Rhodocyclaceae bacterium]|nr:TlpA family protein disulfide reductase [Rhodocyclaceae bacterium]